MAVKAKATVEGLQEAAVEAVEFQLKKQINDHTALQIAEKRRRNLLDIYKAEKKVPVYVSPMYKPYFGNVMQVMINGVSIAFRVDGSTQEVPKSFADEIEARRCAVDDILNKQTAMSNVSQNHESSPGELTLF